MTYKSILKVARNIADLAEEPYMDKKILDIGCGPYKVENSWGIDIFQYPEVDQILDLNNVPWNFPADHFETIYALHVIENVASIPEFMNVKCIALQKMEQRFM